MVFLANEQTALADFEEHLNVSMVTVDSNSASVIFENIRGSVDLCIVINVVQRFQMNLNFVFPVVLKL